MIKYLITLLLGTTLIGAVYAIRTDTNPFYLDSNGVNWLTNDTAYELGSSAARIAKGWFTAIDTTSISIGGVTPFATGSVVFIGTGGALAQDDANFFWNDTNNRLGIGTTGPGAKLEVRGSDTLPVYVNTTDAAAAYIRFLTNSTVSRGAFGYNTTGAVFLNASLNAINMTILDGGNVGIGTTTPSGKFHVVSSSGAIGVNTVFDSAYSAGGFTTYRDVVAAPTTRGYIGFGDTLFTTGGNSTFGLRSQGALTFATNGGTRQMTIDTAGNVGIGTSSPRELFSVANASATTTVYIGAAGFPGRIIMRDTPSGGACTQITTAAGVISGAVVACP